MALGWGGGLMPTSSSSANAAPPGRTFWPGPWDRALPPAPAVEPRQVPGPCGLAVLGRP